MKEVYLTGWGLYYPPNKYSNEDLCKIIGLPERKAKEYELSTGVRNRHMCIDHWNGGVQVMRDDEMATEAAKNAMKVANVTPDDLDMIISVYTTMDYITPGVAERVQSNLKIVENHTTNLIGGCAELVNAFIFAKSLLESGSAETILITASDVANTYYRSFSSPIEWFLTSDYSGALIMTTKKNSPFVIKNTTFTTIGRLQNLMPIAIWGMKEPCPLILENKIVHPLMEKFSTVDPKYRWPRRQEMDGIMEMFINSMERVVKKLVKDKGIDQKEAYVIVPQFVVPMMKEIVKRLDLDPDKIPTLAIEYGSEGTPAPIATFAKAHEQLNGFEDYKYVIFVSLGINATCGGALFEIDRG